MKRFLCFLLISVFMLAVLPFSALSDFDRLYGDINNDGKISSADYISLRLHLLNKQKLTDAKLIYADVNRDGIINSLDYVSIRLQCLGFGKIQQPSQEEKTMTVAYIPLDQRPVNVDRAQYLAASAGINLLMPEVSLFSNALDGQPQNSGGQLGDRAALLEWLKSVEDETDAFVISLDQMFSGGLIGSRWLDNTDLTFEYEIADYIISLTKKKKVYLFDTVMRLASTVGFGGYDMTEYSTLRSYAAVPRKQLYGSQLTVENIINGYGYDENGSPIATSLSTAAVSKYFASRARKLKLADYVFKNSGKDMFCYIGVDDSSPQTTIQSNEIRYITALIDDERKLFAGTDELGLMCLARLCNDFFGAPSVSTSYFGGGESMAADGFDIDTLEVCLQKHYNGLGLQVTDSNKSDISVLVLTRTYNGTVSQNAAKLVKEYEKCVNAGKAAIIIDVSGDAAVLGNALADSGLDLGCIIGYSSWNTAANAIGIALSNGTSRYALISSAKPDTKQAREGFVRSIVFSFCKDVGYKADSKGTVDSYIRSLGLNTNNYYAESTQANRSSINKTFENAMLRSGGFCRKIIAALDNSSLLSDGLKTVDFPKVTLSDFCLPWYRSFEAAFKVNVG